MHGKECEFRETRPLAHAPLSHWDVHRCAASFVVPMQMHLHGSCMHHLYKWKALAGFRTCIYSIPLLLSLESSSDRWFNNKQIDGRRCTHLVVVCEPAVWGPVSTKITYWLDESTRTMHSIAWDVSSDLLGAPNLFNDCVDDYINFRLLFNRSSHQKCKPVS
jgi:hypothetical protein